MFRDLGLRPHAVREVRELQTALGLVAADDGIRLVPAAVQHLRRNNVTYRPLADEAAFSPIFMSTRKGDPLAELALIIRLVNRIYGTAKAGAAAGGNRAPHG